MRVKGGGRLLARAAGEGLAPAEPAHALNRSLSRRTSRPRARGASADSGPRNLAGLFAARFFDAEIAARWRNISPRTSRVRLAMMADIAEPGHQLEWAVDPQSPAASSFGLDLAPQIRALAGFRTKHTALIPRRRSPSTRFATMERCDRPGLADVAQQPSASRRRLRCYELDGVDPSAGDRILDAMCCSSAILAARCPATWIDVVDANGNPVDGKRPGLDVLSRLPGVRRKCCESRRPSGPRPCLGGAMNISRNHGWRSVLKQSRSHCSTGWHRRRLRRRVRV